MVSAELREQLIKRLQRWGESEEDAWRNSPAKGAFKATSLGVEVPSLAENFKQNGMTHSEPSRWKGGQGMLAYRRPFDATSNGYSPFSAATHEISASSSSPVATVAERQAALGSEIEMLREQVSAANAERDEARQQQKHIEAEAVACSMQLGADLSKLRIDGEVLKMELEAVQLDAQGSEQGADDHATMIEEVCRLEQEVASVIIERVRLEGLLRQSGLRESQALQHLEAMQRAVKSTLASGEVFALDRLDEKHDGDASASYYDLEFHYEDGLELSRLMPMQQALQLIQNKSGRSSSKDASGDGSKQPELSDTVSTTASSSIVPGEDAGYEAPLKALELVLRGLRGDCADPEPQPESAIAPAESGCFESHVKDLASILENLQTTAQEPQDQSSLQRATVADEDIKIDAVRSLDGDHKIAETLTKDLSRAAQASTFLPPHFAMSFAALDPRLSSLKNGVSAPLTMNSFMPHALLPQQQFLSRFYRK